MEKPLISAGCPPEAGFTVKTAASVLADTAVMVAVAGAETVFVETGNVAVVWPAGTVTDTGTVAARLLLAKPTTTPPAGAADASVTVPVAV
jgi:hypothetical protein